MQFAHVGLTVSDLVRSTNFYQEAFGFSPTMAVERSEPWIGDVTGYYKAHLAFQHMRLPSGMHLELIQYLSSPDQHRSSGATFIPGNVHFCLIVESIHAALLQALRAGATIITNKPPVIIPEGPNAGAFVVYLRDPDGITIELFQAPRA